VVAGAGGLVAAVVFDAAGLEEPTLVPSESRGGGQAATVAPAHWPTSRSDSFVASSASTDRLHDRP
jgi:hypothetical protein